MRSRLARATFWVVWSRGAVQGISLVATLVVARLLSPEAFGLMEFAAVWTYALTLVAELGLGAAIVQFRELREPEINACFWLMAGLSILGYAVLYLSAPPIARLFANDALSPFLRVVALTVPLVALRIVPESLLRKDLRLDKISQAEMAAVLVYIPTVIGLARAGAGAWALAAGVLAQALVVTLAIYTLARWRPGLRVAGGQLRPLLAFGTARLGSAACYVAYQQADVLILGKVGGSFTLGLYTMARQISQLPVDKISAVVNQLAYPLMAEIQADRAAMRAALLRALRLVACVTLPLCLGIMLLGEDFVLAVLTEKWRGAIPALRLLSLYALVRSLVVLFPPTLLASYRAGFLFTYNLLLLLVMPVAFWIGAVHWQASGVAAAWLVAYPVLTLWMVRETLTEVGLSWRALARHLWPPVMATLVMTGVVVPVLWATASWSGPLVFGRLVLATVSGAGAYAGILFRFHRSATLEIRDLAGWLLRGRRAVAWEKAA
jgi:O-antigen/teichoic acid export membrane protein